MVKRKKIGIVFAEDESWAGGFYYNLNIIRSLNFLKDEDKPSVLIFTANEKYIQTIINIDYPYLEFTPLFPAPRLIDRVVSRLLRKRNVKQAIYRKDYVEFAYPINYYSAYESLKKLKQIYWIPDLQHLHLKENFTAEVIALRESRILRIIDKNFDIVFSSQDSKNDFLSVYPYAQNKLHVLNFPSIMPEIPSENRRAVLSKFGIKKRYFLCSNQFWKHKNHMVLLQAVNILKNEQVDFFVVFTGNMIDYCEKEYVQSLLEYVKRNELDEYVVFLGYIDRIEQLHLIQGSKAVVQPSLFEGWSTIVEDCKALDHFVILSDITVHQEQINQNCLFFNSTNPEDLSLKIKQVLNHPVKINRIGYECNIIAFAKAVVNL